MPCTEGYGQRMDYVPNAITISRIAITPVLLAFLFWDTLSGQAIALTLFVLAAISDYYDGWLARRLGVRSRLGQFLDPMADKVLVLGTLVALAVLMPAVVPWWAVAAIAARDIVVTALRLRAETAGHMLRTIPMAKTKTTMQLVFVIAMLVLLTARHIPGMLSGVSTWVLQSIIPLVLLLTVVAVTVLTGVWYLVRSEYE